MIASAEQRRRALAAGACAFGVFTALGVWLGSEHGARAQVAGSASASASAPAAPPPAQAGAIAIPFEKFKLDNGMVVVLSEAHDVPLVTVNVMVKVGSRFERAHRTGFAHLFEHLMFMGTDRVPRGKYDEWMEAEGGWNNAWTSEDRTFYYDVAPAHALPLLLWMEADRLSALGTTMTQEKLDAQRKVVRNERRQTSENTAYGHIELRLPELLFPEGHPYHHPVIGSHEDLEHASVDDVKEFFATYYVPNNLALVLVGDFDAKAIRPDIERLFGGLAAGKPQEAPKAAAPKLGSVVRETIEEANIQLPMVVMAFHSPARFAPGDAELDVLANILDEGKTSRLYKALVFDKELAQAVEVSQSSQDLSSYFQIKVQLRPGVELNAVESEIDRVLGELTSKGVTESEVERAKNNYETSFVERLQSVTERAATLSTYETYAGDPGFIGKDLERYRAVTATSVDSVARATLDLNQRVVLRIVPKPEEDPKKGDPKAAKKKGAP